jgi:hypothetical protein
MEILLCEADYIIFQMVKGKGGPCTCYMYMGIGDTGPLILDLHTRLYYIFYNCVIFLNVD